MTSSLTLGQAKPITDLFVNATVFLEVLRQLTLADLITL